MKVISQFGYYYKGLNLNDRCVGAISVLAVWITRSAFGGVCCPPDIENM